MSKKAVIFVDMQTDFVNGSLGTKEAQEIVPVVCQIAEEAENKSYIRIFTQDTHDANYLKTQEGKNLPIEHTIENTPGWKIIPELQKYLYPDTIIILKSTFGSLDLYRYIPEDVTEIVLIGLCTDVCLISNAIILKARFPEIPITVYENATAGVSPQTKTAALTAMASCQIHVMSYIPGEL